jgi:uncharacterized protein YndB with AHSA1/START domain
MATISVSLVIERPIEEVFAFLTDARNTLLWQTPAGLHATEQAPEDLVGVGTRITETWRWLGRQMEGTSEVTEYESPTHFTRRHLLGASPIQVGAWRFEPVAAGTRCTFTVLIQAGGVCTLAGPWLAACLKKRLATGLAEVKYRLETCQ